MVKKIGKRIRVIRKKVCPRCGSKYDFRGLHGICSRGHHFNIVSGKAIPK